MAQYKNITITKQFLESNKDIYFVFGDNLIRAGYGGAAILRDHPRTIGFITKKFPDNRDSSFYTPDEYEDVFFDELEKLENIITRTPNKTFYISQLGGGLANKYRIWEVLVKPNITSKLSKFENVIFCWDE
jgi:hypothetical protein